VVVQQRVYGGVVLPETDVARLRRWSMSGTIDCRRARGQIRYELDVADPHVTGCECRPPWRPEYGPEWTRFPIVRFHYTKARREWATYWRDRNLRFHRLDLLAPSRWIEDLLAEVDADSTGIFWG
jgi:hypothetical protein